MISLDRVNEARAMFLRCGDHILHFSFSYRNVLLCIPIIIYRYREIEVVDSYGVGV